MTVVRHVGKLHVQKRLVAAAVRCVKKREVIEQQEYKMRAMDRGSRVA